MSNNTDLRSGFKERFFLKILRPGDVLLYNGDGFFSWIIRKASNGNITHVEVYAGEGKSFASRDGLGVNTYPLRLDNLVVVLRPKKFNLQKAEAYHKTRIGAKYDWFGLVRSFVGNKWKKNDAKAWCSEYVDEVMRAGGVNSFPRDNFSTSISPWDFWQSLAYSRFYVDKYWRENNVA